MGFVDLWRKKKWIRVSGGLADQLIEFWVLWIDGEERNGYKLVVVWATCIWKNLHFA
jgi:hypothetical protein